MQTLSYVTCSRDELIDLSRVFARHVAGAFATARVIGVEINGDYASGKSLVADAMKAEFFGEAEIEKARWKRYVHYHGTMDGRSATVSFVNARYDLLNVVSAVALRGRAGQDGVIFVANKPPIAFEKLFPHFKLPDPSVKINVSFAEGEIRPRQLGPFKFGAVGPMGRREVSFSSILPAPLL